MVPAWHITGAIPFRTALARGAASTLQPVEITREEIAFLQYTGGTTGVSKGAMLTHRNVLANMEQTGAWLSVSFREGTEIAIAPLPLYHIFCLTATLSFMKWGSLIVLITNPRDIPQFVKELARQPFTVITGVNTLYNALLNDPDFAKLDFSRLKLCLGGGAAIRESVAQRWKQVTGRPLIEAYGLTETSPILALNRIDDFKDDAAGIPPIGNLKLYAKMGIDAGNPDVTGSGGLTCQATDQRGVTRPKGAASDIGAFELAPKLVLTSGEAGKIKVDYVFKAGETNQVSVSTNLADWLPLGTRMEVTRLETSLMSDWLLTS